MAAIAWADPDETTAILAQRISASYIAVYKARRRIRAAGGWWCPLTISVCSECARPLLCNAAVAPRQVHVFCETARRGRYDRQYRAEGRSYARSTPYVRAWRQSHPERYAEIEQRKHARDRERWPFLPPEVRAAALARRSEARDGDQALTRSRADRAFRRWTADEDAEVLTRGDEADRELALDLGRSLFAVHTRRAILRKRGMSPP